MTKPAPGVFGLSSRRSCHAGLILTGLVAMGCAQSFSPRQMYEGPPLPKEQVGIVRSGCIEESGLTIMTTRIDGKDIADGCADFALLPGEHHIELSAKQQSPRAEAPVMSSGMVLGGRPAPMGARPERKCLASSGHPRHRSESPVRSRRDKKSSSSAPREWGKTGRHDVRIEHDSASAL